MVQFGCDWCRTIHKEGEAWILGLAAESVGMTAVRREIKILSAWDNTRACHPLAVHFCSEEHKDKYMAALFETEALPAETVIESETTVGPRRRAEQFYVRSASSVTTTKKKKRAITKARRSA